MNIQRYFRDKLFSIVVFIVAIFLVVVTMSLEAFRADIDLSRVNILYAIFLGLFVGIVGLLYSYIRKKRVYDILEKSLDQDLNSIFSLPSDFSHEDELYKKAIENLYRHSEEKLNKYEKKIKLNQDFTNLWIHQMKTPVSVINLLIENGLDKETNVKNLKEEILKISNGLDMALYNLRLQDFNIDFKVERLNLTELTRNVINKNKSNFIMNSVFPSMQVSKDFFVVTDKKWVEFIINQFIQNSIKYTKVKDVDIKKLYLDIRETRTSHILNIRDNGVGIPREDLSRIFDPFYTGENGRKFSESTGMGLYLANIVVDKLGHMIDVDSKEGEYTEIDLIFLKEKNIYSLDD